VLHCVNKAVCARPVTPGSTCPLDQSGTPPPMGEFIYELATMMVKHEHCILPPRIRSEYLRQLDHTERVADMQTTQASGPSVAASKSVQEVVRTHPLFFFFLFAYVFSWLLSIPFVLEEWGILSGDYGLAFVIKSFGPSLAGFLITRIIDGKEGLARLRQSMRQARTGWKWYLFILLALPAPVVLGFFLQPDALARLSGLSLSFVVTYLVSFLLTFFGGGPLGEEPGWRGFALPRLQPRYGPLWGTLLLGVLWTFWHLPDFLTSAQGGGPGTGLTAFLVNLPIFFVFVTALAIIFTWLFNHTGGSVFIAILAHTCINAPQVALTPLFPAVDITLLDHAALIGYGVLALLILIMTRGRLGYQPRESRSLLRQPDRSPAS
jgi:membrane protease YdiL (CAAX protease family)